MNVIYNEGKRLILAGGMPPVLGCMLIKSTYVADPDHLAVDDGTLNDPASHEITAAGYARQLIANAVIGKDITTDFAYLDGDDVVFASILVGDTIGGVLVYKDGAVDTARVPLFFYDVPDVPTNGSAITVQWAAVGAGAMMKAVQGP